MELLIKRVIQCAYNVHIALPPGYYERVYSKALMIELEYNGINAESEVTYDAVYRGAKIGTFRADILVEKKLLIELKAIDNLLPLHGVQLVHYLNMANIENGLLINFGSEKIQVTRKFKSRNIEG